MTDFALLYPSIALILWRLISLAERHLERRKAVTDAIEQALTAAQEASRDIESMAQGASALRARISELEDSLSAVRASAGLRQKTRKAGAA